MDDGLTVKNQSVMMRSRRPKSKVNIRRISVAERHVAELQRHSLDEWLLAPTELSLSQ